MKKIRRVEVLNGLCSLLQALGIVLLGGKLVPSWNFNDFAGLWVLIAISGFGSVVKYFIDNPNSGIYRILRDISAIAGAILVAVACFAV